MIEEPKPILTLGLRPGRRHHLYVIKYEPGNERRVVNMLVDMYVKRVITLELFRDLMRHVDKNERSYRVSGQMSG